MRKSILRMCAVAFGTAALIAIGFATPSLASGATSAAKKVAASSDQTDITVRHHGRTRHIVRNQDGGTTGSVEFSSSARTDHRNTKWK